MFYFYIPFYIYNLTYMRGIFLHTLYSARRDKFMFGLLLGMIFASLIGAFLGSTSLVEPAQMRVVYTCATCRFIIMIGMMVFISFHIKRLFENKEMDVFLSRVPSRSSIVLSFIASFVLISFAIIAQSVIIVSIIYMQDIVNILVWGFSLMLEAIIVVSIATFLSIVIRSSTLGLLLSFATYFLSRVVGNFIAYINLSGAKFSLNSITEVLLKILSIVIPRLDLFGKSDFIVYGSYSGSIFVTLISQAIIYSLLITTLTIMDMRKREF